MGGFHYWPNPSAGPAVVCKCGHDLAAHSGSGVAGVPCKVCAYNRRGWPTGYCVGWDPPTRGDEAEPPAGPHPFVGRQDRWCEQCHRPDRDPIHAPAGPPDLTHAIQAAAKALDDAYSDTDCGWFGPYLPSVAKIAVEAAWPHIRAIQAEAAVLRHSTAQMRDLTRDQDQTIQRLRTFERACRAAVEIEYDTNAILAVSDALATLDLAAPEQHP
jgi:hypothetical protein